MTEEELMDVDLDVVNCLNRLPRDEGYAHYYFSVTESGVASTGGGDLISLMRGFSHILNREDDGNDGEVIRMTMLTSVLMYLDENPSDKKEFKNALKKLSKQ